MRNPKDPRFNQQPGNRLFRTAARQTQKRGVKVSSLAIAAMITMLFTGAGGAFYYLSAPPAPASNEAAAPTPAPGTPTSATLAQVTPSPSPSPTPEVKAARMENEERRSRKKTAPEAAEPSVKEVKAPRTVVEAKKDAAESATAPGEGQAEPTRATTVPEPKETAKETRRTATAKKSGARSETRTSASTREKPAATKSASSKTASKTRVSAATKTAPKGKTAPASTKKTAATKAAATRTAEKTATGKTAAKRTSTPTVPEDTVVVPVGGSGENGGGGETPESAPMQRAKFNMRPESERSANTERVNKLEEFSDAPVRRAPAAKSKKSANPAVETLPPPPEVPDVDGSATGHEQSALEGGESRPQVAMTNPAAPPESPAVTEAPERSGEDYAVQYLGPEVLQSAPPTRRVPLRRPMLVPRQAYARPLPPPPPPVRRVPIVPSATEARRMANDLRQIDGVDVQVEPN